MAAPSRNAPCPCGSGIKYKKCCLSKDQAAAPPGLPVGARLLRRGGDSLVVSSAVSDEMLDETAHHFGERRTRGGLAQQVVEFAQPLMDLAGGDLDRLNKAMALATFCWNLALCEDDAERESLLATLFDTLPDDEQVRSDLRGAAAMMVKRHRQMFPGLHPAR